MTITFCLVLAGVVCSYFQLILGYICRWSTHWFPRTGALMAYNLYSVINAVALANCASDDKAGVWILYLVVLNNSLVTHDPEHILHCLFNVGNIGYIGYRAFRIVDRTHLQGMAWIVAKLLTIALACVLALSKLWVLNVASSKRASEELVEHMKAERLRGGEFHASTLVGYRYLVRPPTTVEDIYSPNRDYGELAQGKDICLSFSLFRLLYRRCQGFRCHEAMLSKSAAFVLENLLPGPERGFAVVEMELAFLHDHIHGGHVLWSPAHYFWYNVALAAVSALLMYAGSVLLFMTRRQELRWHSIAVLALKVVYHMLLALLHCNSNKLFVSHMCRWPGRLDRFMAWLHLRIHKAIPGNYYWQNRIGQCSLLEEAGSTRLPNIIDDALSIFSRSWRNGSLRPIVSAPASLPPSLKTTISHVLIHLGSLTGGVPNLDGVPSVCRGQNQTGVDKIKVMFIWHIATSYCEMQLQTWAPRCGYEVATTLSRYCAYLLAFRPELLPGRAMDTKRIFRLVLTQVRIIRASGVNPWVLPQLIKNLSGMPNDGCAILSDGLTLGSHLMNPAIGGVIDRWRILQNIWVKLVLSIAIQDAEHPIYAKPHADCLAEGGEFLTHLWAMLSHAGITEKQEWPLQQVFGYGDSDRLIDTLRESYDLPH